MKGSLKSKSGERVDGEELRRVKEERIQVLMNLQNADKIIASFAIDGGKAKHAA